MCVFSVHWNYRFIVNVKCSLGMYNNNLQNVFKCTVLDYFKDRQVQVHFILTGCLGSDLSEKTGVNDLDLSVIDLSFINAKKKKDLRKKIGGNRATKQSKTAK